jgi:hypothetical protein
MSVSSVKIITLYCTILIQILLYRKLPLIICKKQYSDGSNLTVSP